MIIAVCGVNLKGNSKEKERKVVLVRIEPRASDLSHQRAQGQRFQRSLNSNSPEYLSLDNLYQSLAVCLTKPVMGETLY